MLLLIVFTCCAENQKENPVRFSPNFKADMMERMQWMNPPESFEVKESTLQIVAREGSDFFNNPEDGTISQSAPFLYERVSGDFVATALVEPDFRAQWNAVGLMVHIDSLNWIKFAFENSDATGPGIVSVVTKNTSDDANGAMLSDVSRLWLAVVRKDDNYAMHWSLDGRNYKMARLTAMKPVSGVKIGIEAQSPVGVRATHRIHSFTVASRTVTDLRNYSE